MATTAELVKIVKKAARELHKGMKRGGFHSPVRGKKGYTRKEKHASKHRQSDD